MLLNAKAQCHLALEELFIDGFLDHFIDKEARKTEPRARRLFSILELHFKTLKTYTSLSKNNNSENKDHEPKHRRRRHHKKDDKSTHRGTSSGVVVKIKSNASTQSS